MADQFYGDRTGTLEDPFGHSWTLATHVEEVPPEELERRFAAMQKQASPAPGSLSARRRRSVLSWRS